MTDHDVEFTFPVYPDKSADIGELASALVKVQAQLKPARMDSDNPFFGSKYASLESCWNCCRSLLAENGLAIIQTPTANGNGRIEVKTVLAHTSGQWISGTVSLQPKKDDPQAAGSAITYGRRYGLCCLVGVVGADVDDDGNTCSAPRETSPKVEPGRDIADEARKKREAAQAVAKKKADAEALVKDVADTLGAEVVRGSEMANVRTNPEYKTRNPEINPVKIEARFLKSNAKSYLYQLLDDGQDAGEIYLPRTQVHSQGTGPDGKNYVWISRWIADEKVKKGKLQPEQVIIETDEDRGDAWEAPPSDGEDVLI
jgi:hypothetical protein